MLVGVITGEGTNAQHARVVTASGVQVDEAALRRSHCGVQTRFRDLETAA